MIVHQIRKYIPCIFAIIFIVISVNSISYKSHSRDENRHLVRGVMLLETGDYRINKHHPILANVLAAVPQLFNDNLVVPSTDSEMWDMAAKDKLAAELIDINGGKRDFVFNVLNDSRYFLIIAFALSGLLAISLINQEFGYLTATIFAFFYYFSPNLIANARLVTTDALVVPIVFAATLYLYRFARNSQKLDLVLFTISGFLALITKYSVVPIAFVWIVILTVMMTRKIKINKFRILKSIGVSLGVIIAWTILLTAAYGFRFETMASTNYEDTQKTADNLNDLSVMLKYTPALINPAQNFYTDVRIPFPEYIHGFLDNVVFHNAYGHDTFLFGQYSKTGWWYYFQLSMLVKVPIPMLIGTVILIVSGIKYFITKKKEVGPLYILGVVPTFFMLLSMSSRINLGIRHILVVFPFMFLGVAYLVTRLIKIKNLRFPIILLGVWYLLSTLMIYPHYLEYFNELVGGPKNGHYYLLDSNLSWAQDDFYVEDYIDKLDTDKKIYRNPLEPIENGIVVIDVDLLMGRDVNKRPKTKWIREKYINGEIEPIDRIAYTYLVFEF